jgi:hypothetical protein
MLQFNAVPLFAHKHVRDFGAVGDGVHDDTLSVYKALNSGKEINFADGTYLITGNIIANNNFYLKGYNASIKSSGSARIVVANTVTEIIIERLLFDGVAIYSGDRVNGIDLDLYLRLFKMQDTEIYGVQVSNLNWLTAEDCSLKNIGTGRINGTYQGVGIRAHYVNKLCIKDSLFEECRGTGAVVIRYAQKLDVYHNKFYKNDYRGIALSNDSDYDFKTQGYINNNIIEECGTYALHSTGVGCNGIYGNDGDFEGLTVSNNKIKNICENGIEGTFGVVEKNIVDGTGVDQVNHSTPSASGINMYGKVYRNNIVKNSYLAAFNVNDNQKLDGTGVNYLIVEGNMAENSDISGTSGGAIYIVAKAYVDVRIEGNITDKPLVINRSATFSNVNFKNNDLPGGDFYSGVYNVLADILGKGQFLKNGFTFSDASHLSNYTAHNVTIERQVVVSDGLNTYYPRITNDTTSYGKISSDIPVPGSCLLVISVTYKDKDIYISLATKDVDGNNGTRLYKTLTYSGSDFITKKIIYNVTKGTAVNFVAKINNGAASESGYIKDITYKCVTK